MNAPDKDGVTPQQHLMAIWKSLGGTDQAKPSDLNPPCEFPELLSDVWQWFSQISQCRSFTEAGPKPIDWRDIQAWREETGVVVDVREKNLIMSLDAAFFASRAK